MARIVNLGNGEQKELYMQHTFGRDPVSATTHINESYVSRNHAVMTWNGDEWQIKDLSRNGTFINSKLLKRDSTCVFICRVLRLHFNQFSIIEVCNKQL